jgi:hypothetical protein
MNHPEYFGERHEFHDYDSGLEPSDTWAILRKENEQS